MPAMLPVSAVLSLTLDAGASTCHLPVSLAMAISSCVFIIVGALHYVVDFGAG